LTNESKIEIAAALDASLVGGERSLDDVAQISQLLDQQGRVILRVRGSSMLPWVKPGDVAIIRRAGINDVRCGDVVLFKRESRLYVHRLVEKQGTLREARFLAKGDAHPGPDGIVDRDLVLGRVVRIYRGNRQIDLDSPIQLALGLIVSQLSRKSAYWYPAARAAAVVAQSAWRLASFLRSPENVPE
jgi:signal peptidase I